MSRRNWLILMVPAAYLLGLAVQARSQMPADPAPDVIRAHRFELIDDSGHIRAALTFSAEGKPRLIIGGDVEDGFAEEKLVIGYPGRQLTFFGNVSVGVYRLWGGGQIRDHLEFPGLGPGSRAGDTISLYGTDAD